MRTYLGLLATALRNAVRSKHELVLENLAVLPQKSARQAAARS